jgi:hypothetical protein
VELSLGLGYPAGGKDPSARRQGQIKCCVAGDEHGLKNESEAGTVGVTTAQANTAGGGGTT